MNESAAQAPPSGSGPGAADPPPAHRLCPHCQAAVPCYRPQQSQYFCCANCRCYFHAPAGKQPEVVIAAKQPQETPRATPGRPLPVGSVGLLGGYRLRITGYQRRSEQSDWQAKWYEYQLAPADEATAAAAAADPAFPLQLAEYNGHWLLVRPASISLARLPGRGEVSPDTTDGNRSYRLWHRFQPRILDLQGEFDWNVLDDEKLHVVELVSPPYQLIREQHGDENPTWYRAKYLEPKQVAAAFGLLRAQLPERHDIGAAQPPPGNISWGRLVQLATAGGIGLLLLQALLLLRASPILLRQEFELPAPQLVQFAPDDTTAIQDQRRRLRVRRDSLLTLTYDAPGAAPRPSELALGLMQAREEIRQNYQQQLAALDQARYNAANNLPAAPLTFVSRSFAMPSAAALSLELEAPDLSNSWVELSASLINEQSGRAYEATRALEFYSGVESGESWHEGSHSTTVDFNAVPAGRYHVNLYPSADPSRTGPVPLRLTVEVDSGLWSNFWLALLALGLPVLVLGIRRSFFEQGRWQNSDYGPTQ